MGVEAAELTDALLRLQHPRAHVCLAGAQLELLLAPIGGENMDSSGHESTHFYISTFMNKERLYHLFPTVATCVELKKHPGTEE